MKTFAGAAGSGTGIGAAITGTLGLLVLWLPVVRGGAPITDDLLIQSSAVVSLWATIVFARRAVAKSGPTQ